MLKQELNVAIFIDCENVNPQIASYALQIAAQFGRVIVRRGYGNNQTLAGKWQKILVDEAFTPCLHYQNNGNKNGADLALALDAFELMFERKADVFCLVTNDSDFSFLCRKLRERGSRVYIVGEQKSSDALRSCSDMFFEFVPRFLPNLNSGQQAAKVAAPKVAVKPSAPKASVNNSHVLTLSQAFKFICAVVQQNTSGNENKIYLGELAKKIIDLNPQISPKNYGFVNWSTMLKNCHSLNVELTTSSYYISLKNAAIKEDHPKPPPKVNIVDQTLPVAEVFDVPDEKFQHPINNQA